MTDLVSTEKGLLQQIEREIPALEVNNGGFNNDDGEGTLVRPMSRPSRDPDTLVRPISRGDRSGVPPPRPSQPKNLPTNYRPPSPEPTPPPRERRPQIQQDIPDVPNRRQRTSSTGDGSQVGAPKRPPPPNYQRKHAYITKLKTVFSS